jgi:hypothetical protein
MIILAAAVVGSLTVVGPAGVSLEIRAIFPPGPLSACEAHFRRTGVYLRRDLGPVATRRMVIRCARHPAPGRAPRYRYPGGVDRA